MVGLEGSIAFAQQHQDIAIGIADQEVEFAVSRQIGEGQPVGLGADRVGDRRQEATLAVAEIDAHATRGENGQVVDSVAGEVAHADDLGGARGLNGDGIGEAASSKAGEHVERVRAGVDRHEIGGTAGRERSGGDARRRLQAGDLGRAGAGVDRGQPRPGAIGLEWTEGPVAQVLQDAHLTGQLVRDHEIEPAASRRIDRLDVGDAQAHGNRHRRQELRGK